MHRSRSSCFGEVFFMLCVRFVVDEYAIKFVTSELVSCSTATCENFRLNNNKVQLSRHASNSVILDMYLSEFAFLLNL